VVVVVVVVVVVLASAVAMVVLVHKFSKDLVVTSKFWRRRLT
jgi:hypothetical protein